MSHLLASLSYSVLQQCWQLEAQHWTCTHGSSDSFNNHNTFQASSVENVIILYTNMKKQNKATAAGTDAPYGNSEGDHYLRVSSFVLFK